MNERNYTLMNITTDIVIDRSCAIYGRSGSGKSTVIKHLLYLLHERVPTTVVFSASESVNKGYSSGYVDRAFIHDHVTEAVINNIAESQKRRRKLYDQINDIDVLSNLFARIANEAERRSWGEMRRVYDDIIAERGRSAELDDKFHAECVKFLRTHLEPHIASLSRDTALPDAESLTARRFNFNPRLTIVFDDCTTELRALKSCDEALELIFRGRHSLCTTIIAIHGRTAILPIMRMNFTLSVFTDSATACDYAKSDIQQPDKRREFMRVAGMIKTEPPHTKMMLYNDQFGVINITKHPIFSAMSDVVREFCDSVSKKSGTGTFEPWMTKL